MILRFQFIAGLLLASLATAYAATYHLDSAGGDDSQSGTDPKAARRSLDKVNATTFQPGDHLLLKAGCAWTGRLHPKGSGNATNRIILDRYGEGSRPAIHGGGIVGGAVLLQNQQYWSIRNLEVSNHGSPAAKKMGILICNESVGTLSGIEVSNCYCDKGNAGDRRRLRAARRPACADERHARPA